ncbi:MAG: carbohydrate binding family 9 domain-containing protein [Candidatus Saccharicenans sp.]|nr:carbohydrate binding family 9 domain-containing protein [Candidatus Saccharicenans sp.]
MKRGRDRVRHGVYLAKRCVLAVLFLAAVIVQGFGAKETPAVQPGFLPKPPKIDGELGNPEWKAAAVISDFVQYEPQEGASPTEKTTVYLGYDSQNLYLAFDCQDSSPEAIRCTLCQRDRVQGDDVVYVYLDTFNDQRRAFVFEANPRGVQVDGVYVEANPRRNRGRTESFDRIDRNWNSYFLSAAKQTAGGYVVEMSIPFKSLRFPNQNVQSWGIILRRQIPRKNEDLYWPGRSRNINGLLIQAGRLNLNRSLVRGKNLELMPTVVGSKALGEKFQPEIGANIKYGITSDLTADLALNPDFSQIEADVPQNEVNQRYPLYYPEKRPFFLEGKDIFDTPFELLYSRKVVSPVWAAKLTGKLGNTSFGVMSALDDMPPGIEIPNAPQLDENAAYRSLNNVLRLRQDLYSESYLGFFASDKEMGLAGSSIFSDYNRLAGIDGQFKLSQTNRLAFQLVGSRSRVDEIKTVLAPAWHFGFNHQDRHLNYSLDWFSVHPEFEAGLGFLRRKDIHSLNARAGYAFLPENDYIISVTPSISYRRVYDYSWVLTDEDVDISLMVSGWRQTFIFLNYSDTFEKYNGVGLKPRQFRFSVFSAPLAWLSGRISGSTGSSIYYDDVPYLGFSHSVEGELNFRPIQNLVASLRLEDLNFYEYRGGPKVYRVTILSQRINFQFNRELFVRAIADYDSYYRKIYLSGLVGYEFNPGTCFYLGMEDHRERLGGNRYQLTGRYYFVKFSYWWRV